MPPNLGGFFMVRSYYPSECHADYFDFERIEALKPAIEACGISTLSQSPMLGFHKQMDNRIKLLEEILSFRMQGVEFDNGDMYVDGHKAASDVRDEFVSVTEKLMDELAQCYNVLPQLDINNTIDHRPEGDEKWFLENEKTVTQFCRKLAAERPLKDIRDEYNYPKKKGIKDECSRLLEASTMKSRRGFAIQRLMNAMRQAHADGWFIVFGGVIQDMASAMIHGELLTMPVLAAIGVLGGLLRDCALDTEDIWRFSPFLELGVYRLFRQRNYRRSAFHLLFLMVILFAEFLRQALHHFFPAKVFALEPAGA